MSKIKFFLKSTDIYQTIFFLIIGISIFDVVILDFNFFFLINKQISLKWISYLFILLFFLVIFTRDKKIINKVYDQKYILFFLIIIFFFTLINYIIFNDAIINNFKILDKIFNLKNSFNINIYLISKFVSFVSLIIGFVILSYLFLEKKINLKNLKKLFYNFFILFIFFNSLIQIAILFNDKIFILEHLYNAYLKIAGSISRDLVLDNFIGKKIELNNQELVITNITHIRFIGIFKEPTFFAYYLSLFFFIDFNKNNIFYFILRFICAYLLIGCVSVKIFPFFLLLIILFYFSLNQYQKKDYILFGFYPFILAVLLDFFTYGFLQLFFLKIFTHLLVTFEPFKNFIELQFNFQISQENFNNIKTDSINKIANLDYSSLASLVTNIDNTTNSLENSLVTNIDNTTNSLENSLFNKVLRLLFGITYLPNTIHDMWILLTGKAAIFNLIFVAGVSSVLFFVQIFKNFLYFSNHNYQNLPCIFFFIYSFQYYFISKDYISLELIYIFLILIILPYEKKN